jgi:hypothetical protein
VFIEQDTDPPPFGLPVGDCPAVISEDVSGDRFFDPQSNCPCSPSLTVTRRKVTTSLGCQIL